MFEIRRAANGYVVEGVKSMPVVIENSNGRRDAAQRLFNFLVKEIDKIPSGGCRES